RERAEARKALYKRMKPLQDEYARLEKELEAVFARQTEAEALLADPEVYADSGRATQLLKDFHSLQQEGERLLEALAKKEEELAPFEEQK
ncbi:hypothetical protein OFN94_33180, partial [Escherichia coli]|nr:hypothetical protein [Escherichia coli]